MCCQEVRDDTEVRWCRSNEDIYDEDVAWSGST